jgi:hypothetical protein
MKNAFINGKVCLGEAAKHDFLDSALACIEGFDRIHRNPRRRLDWITINSRADPWKCNALEAVFGRNFKRTQVAGRKQIRFAIQAAMPDGTHRMNDECCRQTMPLGKLGLANLATTQQAAFLQKVRTGCAMNRAIDPATTQKGRIRGVDDCINAQGRDVSVPGVNEAPQ